MATSQGIPLLGPAEFRSPESLMIAKEENDPYCDPNRQPPAQWERREGREIAQVQPNSDWKYETCPECLR